jgi:hypothetical protein
MPSESKEIQRRRLALHSQIRELYGAPLMRGSVYVRSRRCGKPTCACAKDPAHRHTSKFLSVWLEGRTRGFHLRPEDELEVQRAIDTYDRLWQIINELTACEVAELRRRVRERRRERARGKA